MSDGPGRRAHDGASMDVDTFLEACIAAVFVVRRTPEGVLVIARTNTPGAALLGSSGELDGLDVASTFRVGPEDPSLEARLHAVIATGVAFGFEATVLRPNAQVVQVAARAARHGLAGLIISAIDLTEHRALARRAALDDRLESLGRLAAGVAHELNNPLAWVVANLEHVRENLASRGDTELAQLLGECLEGTSRMRVIVRDLRPGELASVVDPYGIEVEPVVRAAARMAAHRVQPHAHLDVRVAPGLRRVIVDSGRLTQVLTNMVLNATHAIEDSGRYGSIVVEARDVGRGVVITVTDDGVGMDEATLNGLLEPFFTTRSRSGGTGLGLWVSRSIIRAAGGTLTLTSTLGVGTEARIELRTPDGLEVARAADTRSTRPPSAEPERLRVLIVDDEPLVARALARILGRAHDVVTESSAQSALDRIQGGARFDLVLSDMTMPGLDGVAFLMTAETLDEGLEGRIVLVTGGTSAETEAAVLARGVTILGKPFEAASLRKLAAQFRRREAAGAIS